MCDSFTQASGYRPQPLDLSGIELNQNCQDLVEQLAENTHNVWSKERIKQGWTYGLTEVWFQLIYFQADVPTIEIYFWNIYTHTT